MLYYVTVEKLPAQQFGHTQLAGQTYWYLYFSANKHHGPQVVQLTRGEWRTRYNRQMSLSTATCSCCHMQVLLYVLVPL